MQTEMFPIDIQVTPKFEQDVKRLNKKYPHIQNDLEDFIGLLRIGRAQSERIQGTSNFLVFKARIRNTDNLKGKSGGYRIIYYLVRNDQIVFLTIYSKSEQADILPKQIVQIIKESIPASDQ
jgi:mRNA-degrading endonuclease RelE of RelBE toxin-antitoxin system